MVVFRVFDSVQAWRNKWLLGTSAPVAARRAAALFTRGVIVAMARLNPLLNAVPKRGAIIRYRRALTSVSKIRANNNLLTLPIVGYLVAQRKSLLVPPT